LPVYLVKDGLQIACGSSKDLSPIKVQKSIFTSGKASTQLLSGNQKENNWKPEKTVYKQVYL